MFRFAAQFLAVLTFGSAISSATAQPRGDCPYSVRRITVMIDVALGYETDIDVYYSGSSALALALSYITYPCPTPHDRVDGGADARADFSPGGNSEAVAYSFKQEPNQGEIWATAHAQTWDPSITAPEVVLDTWRVTYPALSQCNPNYCIWPTGAAIGLAQAWYYWECVTNCGWSVDVTSSVSVASEPAERLGITRRGTIVRLPARSFTSIRAVLESQNGSDAGTYVKNGNQWEAIDEIEGVAGDMQMSVGSFDLEEDRLDVNRDGRFNVDDVTALIALLNSTDPDDLQWDYNGTGVIDAMDVELLSDLIAEDLDSGVLGDRDQDGDADCADLTGIDSLFGYNLGSSNYRIELDANLDGKTDTDDRWWVYHVINPADFNADGAVNSQDFFDFYACWSTACSHADFNDDGFVDSNDYFDFLTAFYSPNC